MTVATPATRSLAESHRSIVIPEGASFLRRLFAFAGPGYLGRGRLYGPRQLGDRHRGRIGLWLCAPLGHPALQHHGDDPAGVVGAAGIAAGLDLAQACRAAYSKPVSRILWLLCEIAIIACDLAEVLGTAIALQLLFDLPLVWGVLITGLDVFLILALQRYGFRKVEAFIIALPPNHRRLFPL